MCVVIFTQPKHALLCLSELGAGNTGNNDSPGDEQVPCVWGGESERDRERERDIERERESESGRQKDKECVREREREREKERG